MNRQTLVRKALSLAIGSWSDMEVIAQACDAQGAWQSIRQSSPDMVIFDIPNRNFMNIQVIKRLKLSYPRIHILGLARHLDKVGISQMVKAGATGCVLKTSASHELERAIRVVADGGCYLDSHIDGKIKGGRLLLDEPDVTADLLSAVQLEILKMVALGYTNGEISRELHFSIKTIEAQKAKINQKLDLQTKADLIRFSYQRGWMKNEV